MQSVHILYENLVSLKQKITSVDAEMPCLVQIFTNALQPDDAVSLAKQVQIMLPKAQIIGSSVSGVIFEGVQYDNHTILVIEQYQYAILCTKMISLHDQTYRDVARIMRQFWLPHPPQLLRMFVGNYYDFAHQLIARMDEFLENTQIVGGMAGELYQNDIAPYVFDATQWQADALIFAGISGEDLTLFGRINTSHETISPVYTITEAHGREIRQIEQQAAKEWLQRNLGFLSTKQYSSWEDIAQNDPLVRFQIALESYQNAIRFVRFDESTQQICQYFSRLESGTKFRLSYTSPARCVEECKQTCLAVQTTPIEHLFCYSCLFRKLYLKNCAQWELTPFHRNPVSGVFLLGEFGCDHGVNVLLNGSCVLSGIAEEEAYQSVDLHALNALETIKDENEGLLDFILRKQKYTMTVENSLLFQDVIARENDFQQSLYENKSLRMGNMLGYEKDKERLQFDKLCLMKIENADVLMSYWGQQTYFERLQQLVQDLYSKPLTYLQRNLMHAYSIHTDAFVVAANEGVTKDEFILSVERFEQYCNDFFDKSADMPMLIRFVVIMDSDFLLEQAYAQLQRYNHSQSHTIVEEVTDRFQQSTRAELEAVNLIQYALLQDKVVPFYQGIHNNLTGKIDKYEALMRISNRNGEILAPYHYMDVAKKYRMYLDLNLRMFEAVIHDFSQIDFAVNINLSAHDISSPRFRNVMRKHLRTFHKPHNLTFEILEDEYFSDIDTLKDFIAEVRGYGVKVAVDDFGSGYSNLLELMRIHPDFLKIDGQIIRDIDKKYENEVIVDAVTTLGQKLDIQLVAEFVENESIQHMVQKYGILYSQGYLFSKPKPFAEICKDEALLQP